MFRCPNCRSRMSRQQAPAGMYLLCPNCQGLAVGIPVLRKVLQPECVQQAWAGLLQPGAVRARPCAVCNARMFEVPVGTPAGDLQVDVCRACQFVWLDRGEIESLPQAHPPAPKPKPYDHLPPAAREALAIAEVERLAREQEAESQGQLECDWRLVPGLLGLPVENAAPELACTPWATYTLGLLVFAASLLAMKDLVGAVQTWGIVPAEFLKYGGVTLLTSFFIHGGWAHLISNLWFMITFGDNVEDFVGPLQFLLLILLATLAGDLLHVCLEPRGDLPTVGASGGISGLIAFYALLHPKAQIGFLVRYRWLYLPAWLAFVLWVGLQVWQGAAQMQGLGNVSALAHLGGAAVGVVYWMVYRKRDPAPRATACALE